MTKVIEFILNYIFIPVFMIFWGIWKLISKLIKDVTSHIYGKILVPFIAVAIVAFIVRLFTK